MRAFSLRPSLPQKSMEILTLTPISPPFLRPLRPPTLISPPFLGPLFLQLHRRYILRAHLSTAATKSIPISDEALMGFITGKRKATEVAHSVWKNVIQRGDTVVDATCGNGYDTLALLKMVADESGKGCVYGMDIQRSALESTSSLLEESVDQNERKLVRLSLVCHSKMEDVIPRDTPVRLVAFNLGYLPGGDKTIITRSPTTLLALQAAGRTLQSGGLISLVVYVGHPGGRDELETVRSFASRLPMESWISCKLEMFNRPTCPVIVFLYKK